MCAPNKKKAAEWASHKTNMSKQRCFLSRCLSQQGSFHPPQDHKKVPPPHIERSNTCVKLDVRLMYYRPSYALNVVAARRGNSKEKDCRSHYWKETPFFKPAPPLFLPASKLPTVSEIEPSLMFPTLLNVATEIGECRFWRDIWSIISASFICVCAWVEEEGAS